ncbi:flagellar hook-associated protein FlgK [Caulobacter sp. SLTY]|uniref:flagellar hook-associated protein FlgK n=1 Tax=Caulobacter sp. SLTY TaxID=2683262 RepID=UPI001411CFBE|nr:flagellar hook-associated protein FlgK [Caulobacter sp. SLTY]NBB16976.1 flagellar hook-associated protein FlgK [Caulobacter sp. SLTY]
MSLNSIMSSATTGLMAAQTGLRAVSDNVANVNTAGYVRKLVQQKPLISAGLGVGVDVARIILASDQYLQKAAATANASAAQASVTADSLDRAQALFGDPSGKDSFFARLDTLYAAFSAAADEAASSVRRGAALDTVNTFLSEAGRIDASLGDLAREADSRIAAGVDRVNQLLLEINDLNGQVTSARVHGDSTGSETIQNGLIDELATLIDINATRRENGAVVIRASDGVPLAGIDGAAKLNYVRSDGATGEITVTLPGAAGQSSLRARLTGGELRGLLDLRDKELPAIGQQLSEFVTRAVDELNRAHNAASAVPPPASLTGRNTGLDLPTAVSGFSGTTSLAIVSPNGTLQRQVDINFSAGTMSVDGGAATAFTPANFLTQLNGALGGMGTASFANGALSLNASGGNGIAFTESAANPSAKVGKTFSHFFGLNDLVTSDRFAFYDTGLKATDAHGFTAGETITFRVADSEGARIRDVAVAVPAGGSMQDLLNALNATSGGVGLYGQFSLDADGQMAFSPTNGGISVISDNTQRGAGGPSISELFGIGGAQRSGRAGRFEIRADIAADPSKLALAKLDLTQDAAGRPVLSSGDGAGALLLAKAGETNAAFDAAGGLGSVTMSVSRYASELAGSVGRRAEAAIARRDTAQAVAAEATERRASVEGVNLDEELVAMTTYQQAFNASARVIQASKDMYDTLLGMMGA